MLTVYFEHCKDAKGNAYMELVISSNGREAKIDWKRDGDTYDEISKILKSIITQKRFFDPQRRTWTYFGGCGQQVISALRQLQALFNTLQTITSFKIVEISDLVERLAASDLRNPIIKSTSYAPEDFFYTPVSVKEPRNMKLELARLLNITTEDIRSLFQNDFKALRKIYLRRAMELHPDKNNGDGSKMSELNELWQNLQSQGMLFLN